MLLMTLDPQSINRIPCTRTYHQLPSSSGVSKSYGDAVHQTNYQAHRGQATTAITWLSKPGMPCGQAGKEQEEHVLHSLQRRHTVPD